MSIQYYDQLSMHLTASDQKKSERWVKSRGVEVDLNHKSWTRLKQLKCSFFMAEIESHKGN